MTTVNGLRAAGVLVGAFVVAGCSADSGEPVAAASASSSASASTGFGAPAPSPSATTSSTTATTTSAPPPKPLPASIPDSAFLQASDAPAKAKEKPKRLGADGHPLPAFCNRSYEQKDQLAVRGTELFLIASKDATEGSTPEAAIYENVLVYRGDGATKFMQSLRTAVKACASAKDADSGVTVKNFLRGPVGGGDDSELIEQTRPATDDAGEPVAGQVHHVFWAAVRQGDTIAFVSNTGWESGSGDKADTLTLGKRAATRVQAWRG
jgi:hypothetical protein